MATLQFSFLGPLEIRCDHRLLPHPPTLKSQSLLAYLVYHRRSPHPRDLLAGLFFGERSEHQARRSLSTSLWHIHRCLSDESALLIEPQTIQFDPLRALWLDVDEFEALTACKDRESLHSAVALYRGDFLEGFYDDWIISERYRLESLYLETLARLMVIYEIDGDPSGAVATALRLLGRDPLREDAYQIAIRALCRLGQRKAALEQYERCCKMLESELGAQPMAETRELYEAILTGAFTITLPPVILPAAALPVASAGRDPLDAATTVRLVGREHEAEFLEACWQDAQTGNCRLALVSGEVGVGKTRLVDAFANHLRWQGLQVLWGRCYEYERILPYQPIADLLRSALPTLSREALINIPAWVISEVARLVPELLELPGIGKDQAANSHKSADHTFTLPPIEGADPAQVRLFAGVTRFLTELATKCPLLVVLEDLHWAGESTLQMLHYLVRSIPSRPILLLGTFRTEAAGPQHPLRALYTALFRERWVRQLDLTRLPPKAIETIILEISGAGDAVLPLARRLYSETEGNPFFLMEIVKALFETSAIQLKEGVWQGDFTRLSETAVPISSSMSEAVQARVQRLSEAAQDGLRLAAVIGREFNDELLRIAWGKGDEATLELFDELLRHRLIEEKTGPNDSDFVFTHHKIQEIVYQGLSRHRCLHLHARVGTAMEIAYPTELETRAGELAHHFELAFRLDPSLSTRAIRYLLKAGQQAVRQFANEEAIAFYQRGLDILRTLPNTDQRMHQEVELQLALAVPTMAIKGYASPETKRVYDRARDLCERLSKTQELFTALVGLKRYYGLTGDLTIARRLSEQLLDIAQATRETDILVEAYRQMGCYLFQIGRLKEAREYLESCLRLYNPSHHERLVYQFAHDPAAACLGYLGITLWLLGYPEQSQAQSQKLFNLTLTITHPTSLACAYIYLAKHAYLRHAPQDVCDYAEKTIQICQSHEQAMWMLLATALKGWALCEQGQAGEGFPLLEESTRAFQATGMTHITPFLLSLQAETCLKLQNFKDGADLVMAALAVEQSGGDCYWDAALQRLQGELVKAQNKYNGHVDVHFYQAIETAQQQGARMLELLAAISLARLRLEQDRPQEARRLITGIYDQFTEGFETCELQAAHALLHELLTQP